MENNINFDKEMRRIYNAALSALMDAAMPVMITLLGDRLAGMSAEVCQKCAPFKPYVLNICIISRVSPVSSQTSDFYLADADYGGDLLWQGAISRWELPTLLEKSLSVAIGFPADIEPGPEGEEEKD